MRSCVPCLLAFSFLWTLAGMPAKAVDQIAVQATWTAQPLRDVAGQLSRLAGRPVVLDRRIDPTLPITLTAASEPLEEVVAAVAAKAAAELIPLESLLRIGPPATAARCIAAEQARRRALSRLPAPQRAVLDATAAWTWPAGSRPRDLVSALAAEHGLSFTGLDRVPHDHFPAAEFPPLSLADRIDLVLAHFDLCVDWSRGPTGRPPSGRIMPLPEAAATVAAVTAKQSPRRPRPAAGRQAYTLRLEAPLDDALAAVGKQLGLAIAIDDATLAARGISSREIARADVRSVSRDELLDTILDPLGLSWEIERDTLRVWAEPPARP